MRRNIKNAGAFFIWASILCLNTVEASGVNQTETSAPIVEDAEETEDTSRVDAAVSFAANLTENATRVLSEEGADPETKLKNFQLVLADGLDVATIAKFMLGETRNELSDDQQARYDAAFPEYITRLYAEQFEQIVGKPLTVVDAQEIGRRDVIVRTRFDRKDDTPILVDWRVRESRDGERKAIDIIVEGVSIMLVKREEFSSYIAANGVDALIDQLETEA